MVKMVGAAVMLAAALASAAASADDPAQVSQRWARAWQAKRLETVVALYTEDAVFLDADGSHVDGRPAIRQFFARVLSLFDAVPHLRSIDTAASGDFACDWGEYDESIEPVASHAQAVRIDGTYLVVLRRLSGHWLIARQVWTRSPPAPAPAR